MPNYGAVDFPMQTYGVAIHIIKIIYDVTPIFSIRNTMMLSNKRDLMTTLYCDDVIKGVSYLAPKTIDLVNYSPRPLHTQP